MTWLVLVAVVIAFLVWRELAGIRDELRRSAELSELILRELVGNPAHDMPFWGIKQTHDDFVQMGQLLRTHMIRSGTYPEGLEERPEIEMGEGKKGILK